MGGQSLNEQKSVYNQMLRDRLARMGLKYLLWDGLSKPFLMMSQNTTHSLSYCGASSDRNCGSWPSTGYLSLSLMPAVQGPLNEALRLNHYWARWTHWQSKVSLHPVFSWWLDFLSSTRTAVFWDVSWLLPSHFFSLFNTLCSPWLFYLFMV